MTHVLRFAAALALAAPSAVVAQAPDHYLCYDAAAARKPAIVAPPATLPQERTLEDQLGAATYDVTKHRALCNPASKNGEHVERPDVHQVGYAIRRQQGEPSFKPRITRRSISSARSSCRSADPTASSLPRRRRSVRGVSTL